MGNSGVGKSSIVLRLTDNHFTTSDTFTIGVDFGSTIIHVKDCDIKLHIWDSAGQEAFRSIARSYYRGVAGVLLVYDITNRQSFNQIPNWLNEILQENPNQRPAIMLIGNKSDVKHRQVVTTEEGKAFAKNHGFLFAETSAKLEDQNVHQVFSQLTEKIYDGINSGEILPQESNGIRLYPHVKLPSESPQSKASLFCCFQ